MTADATSPAAPPLTEMAKVYRASEETTAAWRAACDAVTAAEAALADARRNRDAAMATARSEAEASARADFNRLVGLPRVGATLPARAYGYPMRRNTPYRVDALYCSFTGATDYYTDYYHTGGRGDYQAPVWRGVFHFEPRIGVVSIRKDGSDGKHSTTLSVQDFATKAEGRQP